MIAAQLISSIVEYRAFVFNRTVVSHANIESLPINL